MLVVNMPSTHHKRNNTDDDNPQRVVQVAIRDASERLPTNDTVENQESLHGEDTI